MLIFARDGRPVEAACVAVLIGLLRSRVIPDVTAEKPHDGLGKCRLIRRTTDVTCPQVSLAGNPDN